MIRFTNVYKAYPNGAMALKDVTFHVSKGEFVFLTGHSGAGKSTIMRAVSGLLRPVSSDVRLAGRRIEGLEAHRVASAGLALVPEGRQVLADLSRA